MPVSYNALDSFYRPVYREQYCNFFNLPGVHIQANAGETSSWMQHLTKTPMLSIKNVKLLGVFKLVNFMETGQIF